MNSHQGASLLCTGLYVEYGTGHVYIARYMFVFCYKIYSLATGKNRASTSMEKVVGNVLDELVQYAMY